MRELRISFWNVNNLFDTNLSNFGSDVEFTPSRGWSKAVKNKKIENLSSLINSLHSNSGPDLLGIAEVETEELVSDLVKRLSAKKEYAAAQYLNSPDVRGIDTALIYSQKMLKLNSVKSYNINIRYPTRDIYVANFTVIENGADLNVLVNHWPSRAGGRYETEPLRIAVAENCAKAVEDLLKISGNDLEKLPIDIKYNNEALKRINSKWNRNVLLMGDFNDNPYDKSILNYLHATPDKKKLLNWDEIFEHPSTKRWPMSKQTDKHNYLFYQGYLFNCMWPIIPDGTMYYNDGFDLFDQFIVSRGLLNGEQQLKIDLESVRVNKKIQLDGNISEHNFDIRDKNKIHPSLRHIPMRFEYQRIKPNGDFEEIPAGRSTLTGYSDHFPIESVIKIL